MVDGGSHVTIRDVTDLANVTRGLRILGSLVALRIWTAAAAS